MRLQVERDLLVGGRVGEVPPGVSLEAVSARAGAPATARSAADAASSVLAIAGIAVIVLDVALALLDRIRPPHGRRAT